LIRPTTFFFFGAMAWVFLSGTYELGLRPDEFGGRVP